VRDDLAIQAAALLRVAADLSLPATGSPGAARGGRPPSWPSGARCSTPPAKPVGIRSGLPWASGERHGNVFPSALQDHASGLLAF
jgi:hypothetical protein